MIEYRRLSVIMPDPRISAIELDEATISWRNADVEQERRVAIFDLLEANHFAPLRPYPTNYAGPYRVRLAVQDGRLAIQIASDDDQLLETLLLSLTSLRRQIREYFAICDSYFTAVSQASAQAIETVDLARRALHNQAAELLIERLAGKIVLDFATARRLFTLICVLHMKG
jgi:uncharacterized protein (UPF0262 family)